MYSITTKEFALYKYLLIIIIIIMIIIIITITKTKTTTTIINFFPETRKYWVDVQRGIVSSNGERDSV